MAAGNPYRQLQLPAGCKTPEFSGMCSAEILGAIASRQIPREMIVSA